PRPLTKPLTPTLSPQAGRGRRNPAQRVLTMSLPSSVDVAIIGAGAAGLGAANALRNSGLSIIVLEARGRVGGRAHTIQPAPDGTFDVGWRWAHSVHTQP